MKKSVESKMTMTKPFSASATMIDFFAKAHENPKYIVSKKMYDNTELEDKAWALNPDKEVIENYCGDFRCKVFINSETSVWVGVGGSELATAASLNGDFIIFSGDNWNKLLDIAHKQSVVRRGSMSTVVAGIHAWLGYGENEKVTNGDEVVDDIIKNSFTPKRYTRGIAIDFLV